jgi:hypothetical protein
MTEDAVGCEWFENTFEPLEGAKQCSEAPNDHGLDPWGKYADAYWTYCIATPDRSLPLIVRCVNSTYSNLTKATYQVFLP